MEKKHTYMAAVMQIGQEMINIGLCISVRIIMAPSVSQAGNNPQLPSPQLKLNMMLCVQLHKKLYGYAI